MVNIDVYQFFYGFQCTFLDCFPSDTGSASCTSSPFPITKPSSDLPPKERRYLWFHFKQSLIGLPLTEFWCSLLQEYPGLSAFAFLTNYLVSHSLLM
jgi:hypothetical protein